MDTKQNIEDSFAHKLEFDGEGNMFEGLSREKVIETSDIEKRNAIQDVLYQHDIDYKIICKDIYQRNIIDTAKMGQVKTSKYVYYFWVKKEQVSEALRLVKSLGR